MYLWGPLQIFRLGFQMFILLDFLLLTFILLLVVSSQKNAEGSVQTPGKSYITFGLQLGSTQDSARFHSAFSIVLVTVLEGGRENYFWL